jgi:hypothetical protein
MAKALGRILALLITLPPAQAGADKVFPAGTEISIKLFAETAPGTAALTWRIPALPALVGIADKAREDYGAVSCIRET